MSGKSDKDQAAAEHDRELIRLAEQEANELLESTAQKLPPPDSVPGFRIISEVGRGGMGVVYKAVQLSTNRIVALKVMLAGPFASQSARLRFEHEVRTAARFKHPGIVRVLQGGEASAGPLCYAMDYLEGMQLNRWWHSTKPDVPSTLRVFVELCRAVEYAHSKRVVHRDLKPANVLIDNQDRPHILDFGLSKATDSTDGRDGLTLCPSVTGQVLGTLPYLSPEQASGKPVEIDARTDVYALGAMLYEMVSGSLPFGAGGGPSRVIQRIQEDDPKTPSSLNPRVNRDLDTVILKALEKEKRHRYQSAAEFREDLQRCLRGERPLARPQSALDRARRAVIRHRVKLYVVAACLGVILGVFGAQALWRGHSQRVQQARQLTAGRKDLLVADMLIDIRAAGALEYTREHTSRLIHIAEARLIEARAEHRIGQTNIGIAALEDAIHYDSAQSAARALLAEIYREQGEERIADGVVLQPEVVSPETAEDWYVRSFGTLDRALALDYLQKAIAADGAFVFAWQRMLQLHVVDRNLDEAETCADKLLVLTGGNQRSMILRGHTLMLAGRFDDAVEQFTDLIAVRPDSSRPCRFRANAHRGAGEYEEALADLKDAWDRECDQSGAGSSWLLFQRITPLWILGRLEEAAETCVRAHEKMLIPTYADARHFLILQSLERPTEGEEVMQRALATCRNPWLRNIFECLNGELAPADLVDAAANEEHRCEAYYYAGESCLLRGRTNEAVEWFRKCVDTQLMYDPNTWTLEPMNEYELARWRLQSLAGGAQSSTEYAGG